MAGSSNSPEFMLDDDGRQSKPRFADRQLPGWKAISDQTVNQIEKEINQWSVDL
jgi:hypothetical protein